MPKTEESEVVVSSNKLEIVLMRDGHVYVTIRG